MKKRDKTSADGRTVGRNFYAKKENGDLEKQVVVEPSAIDKALDEMAAEDEQPVPTSVNAANSDSELDGPHTPSEVEKKKLEV